MSLALALAIAVAFRDLYSVDMDAFLLPWFTHIQQAGPIGAFATPFSNYTPPYLYLLAAASPLAAFASPVIVIKLVSVIGQLFLTWAITCLLSSVRHPHPWPAAALIALAPTLIINSTLLTQCDAYWAAMLVIALTAAIERRHAAMFAWCGLAIAFKAQAAFIGPFFLALAIARRIPFRLWAMAPLAALLAMLPAMMAGWPAGDLLTIYLRQTQWESLLALNAPNVWMIAQTLGGAEPRWFGSIAILATIAAIGCYTVFFARRLHIAEPITLLRAATLCALIVPGLLPRMHERYFFLGDALVLALAAVRPSEWRAALFAQIGSGLGILAYLTGGEMFAVYGALAMIYATWLIVRPFIALGAAEAPTPSPA
ncbi:MAG: hypothetical protein P0Y64_07145 [Candidatus Sphingomonas colombiensis]|nr:hypothetical protein [Sphingomonas sp.]WEK44555.1 MAG: hypothetical protein P0Y64_07145 [Sphingomonas sp.]